jgi:hypothetical protein
MKRRTVLCGSSLVNLSILVCVLLPACNARELVPSALMLSTSDLPGGWGHDRTIAHPPVSGADTRGDSFHYGQQKYWLVISHELAVFRDVDSAKTNFAVWQDKYFPAIGNWTRPDTATFVPSNLNDLYRFGCILNETKKIVNF